MQVNQDGSIEPVITLRDQFAMAALTGLLAQSTWRSPEAVSERAYQVADAMIRARPSTEGE